MSSWCWTKSKPIFSSRAVFSWPVQRRQLASQQKDQGGFAGAVGAQQADARAGFPPTNHPAQNQRFAALADVSQLFYSSRNGAVLQATRSEIKQRVHMPPPPAPAAPARQWLCACLALVALALETQVIKLSRWAMVRCCLVECLLLLEPRRSAALVFKVAVIAGSQAVQLAAAHS